MTFPNSARYGWVIKLVHKFLLENNISSFPVDPFKIIEANKWGLITFTELATEHNVSIAEVIEAFQSEDGYTMYDGSGYTIAYNDTIGSPGRIRFTLMHEIGHIYLKHLVDFEETILRRSTLTERKYKVLENETNCFARNVLAPAPIVNRLKLRSAIDLVHHFHVTEAAARTRLDLLKRDSIFTINFALSLINQFRKYLHIVANSKYCYCCKYHFLHETAVYCPICGSRKLSKRKGFEIMNYSGIKVDENYRAIQCPTCENENVYGEYCQICGTYLVNKCTGFSDEPGNRYVGPWHNEFPNSCGIGLNGDARFCIQCGSTSTFYESGLLKDWVKVMSESTKDNDSSTELLVDPFGDPFGIQKPIKISDDDLPF